NGISGDATVCLSTLDESKSYHHIGYIVSILMLSLVMPLQGVHEQASIRQSTTSEVNGQKTSVQTENDKTIIKNGDRTLTIEGNSLRYCVGQSCHEYVLYPNGTIKKK